MDTNRDEGWHDALGQAGLSGERPVSRRERIAAMREQAREAERQQNFRYGLIALAALAVIVAAVIIAVVH